MATAAQIEANRRNARRSTGPRTEAGKNRSRLNALDHGCRALIPVLPNEDRGEYETRCNAWTLSFKPRNPSEELLIERLVSLDLQAKRIDRAQTARLTKRMYCGLHEEDAREQEKAIELGQTLFRDACGPRALHLQQAMAESIAEEETRRVSDYSRAENHPMRLIHGLQSTGAGCQWLLDQWANLRDLLERGVPWIASDQLKAVRLLGRHPIDAVDSSDVARVYLASHVLLNQGGQPFQEILSELSPDEAARYEKYLNLRDFGALAPKDATAARQVLLEIIDKATEELEDKAGVFRELAEIDALTAGDRLSWDDTPEGERLRRYELTCKRAWLRMFELLMKVRCTGEELGFATIASLGRSAPVGNIRAIDTTAPAVANVITRPAEPVKESDPPSEAKPRRETAPNEANSGVPTPGSEGKKGNKAFRIDTPALDRNFGDGGMSAKDKIHRGLHDLETGRRSPPLLPVT